MRAGRLALFILCATAILLAGTPQACACDMTPPAPMVMTGATCSDVAPDAPAHCPDDDTSESHACGHCVSSPAASCTTSVAAVPAAKRVRQDLRALDSLIAQPAPQQAAPVPRAGPRALDAGARLQSPSLRALSTVILLT